MNLSRLELHAFRNYERASLELAPGVVLLLGANAQGKTNLLEAVFLLATGRADRASGDADLIGWKVREDSQPVARVVGQAQRSEGEVSVEVIVAGRPGAQGMVASKRFKLNGVARRAQDVVGAVLAVLFTTDDMELVRGAPAGRRRYMDIMLTQAGRPYRRALQRYNKLITQRNALLRRIGEGEAKPSELPYWDEELAREGAALVSARAQAMSAISERAAEAHAALSDEREAFAAVYEPRLSGWTQERAAAADEEELTAALIDKFQAGRQRDIGAGVTLSGPHRDDVSMTLGGEPAASFASRGQQRTAALALRIAEAALLEERTGERPILLLDDVLSELDESRRAAVLQALREGQALITSADADRFPAAFTADAQVWRIDGGVAVPASR